MTSEWLFCTAVSHIAAAFHVNPRPHLRAAAVMSGHQWTYMPAFLAVPKVNHACRRSQRRWRFRFRRPAFALEVHPPEVALQALHSWRSSGLSVKLILQALTYTIGLVPCRWASAFLCNSSEKIRCLCTLGWFMARASGCVRVVNAREGDRGGGALETSHPHSPMPFQYQAPISQGTFGLHSLETWSVFVRRIRYS